MINQNLQDLPAPSPDAQIHSERLHAFIRKQIAQNQGNLPFHKFMQHALYAAGLGYYSAGSYKIGQQGDFTTAPEISPLFSYCLANQCAEVLSEIEQGDILELGAGSGKMAGDILTHLNSLNQLPNSYYILEISADLKERQHNYLKGNFPQWLDRIHWLSELPQNFQGTIVANEVIDAMPVHLFEWQNRQLQEYFIGLDDNEQFTWKLNQPSSELQKAFETIKKDLEIDEWHTPYISEINLLLPGWIESLNNCLTQGVILFIDYGFPRHEYYHPQRNQGTLMCHYQHRSHTNPLALIGLQDITAHVDFTAVTENAVNAGLELEGFVTQANFLLNCELADFLNNNLGINDKTAIKRLTMPSEMGEFFKVIGFSKNYEPILTGFTHYDMSYRL